MRFFQETPTPLREKVRKEDGGKKRGRLLRAIGGAGNK